MRVKKYYQDAGILTTKGVMKSRINADELFPIITDGEGTKFLADNGEYLEATSGGVSVQYAPAEEVELNCTWGTKKIYRQRFTGTVNAGAEPVSTVIKAELGAKLIVAIYGGRTDTVIPAGAISDNGELLTIKMVGTDLAAVATTGSAGTAESFTYDISIDYTKT